MDNCPKCNKNKVRYSPAFNREICYNCKACFTKEMIFIDYDSENSIIVKNNLSIKNIKINREYPEVTKRLLENREQYLLEKNLNDWFNELSLNKKKELFEYAKTTTS